MSTQLTKDAISVTEDFSLLDVVRQVATQTDVRATTTIAIPLRSDNEIIGEMLVSPTAWGNNELVAVFVVEQNTRNILVMSVPPSPVPITDQQTAIKNTWIIKSVRAAGSALSAAAAIAAFGFASPIGAALVGIAAGAYTEKEMGTRVLPSIVPRLVEQSGHRPNTFYQAANWLGLFSATKREIYVLGSLSLGQPRGTILYDKQHWEGGVYISGNVEPCLPEIQHFSKRCSVPFICHSPTTGEVWYVRKNKTHKGFGHCFDGRRVVVEKLTPTDTEAGETSLENAS